MNIRRALAGVVLLLVSAVWGYIVLVQDPEAERFCAAALAGGAFVSALAIRRCETKTISDRWLLAGTILLPCYVWIQTILLPIGLVRAVSPVRASIQDALAPILPGVAASASLSVSPDVTLTHLVRLLEELTLFWIVFRQVRHRSSCLWIVAAPIMVIGTLEAALGILQYASDPGQGVAQGTYENRNHFAGLMEMSLPFWLMASASALERFGVRTLREPRLMIQVGSCFLSSAAVILAVLLSLSRTGTLLVFLSMFLMSALFLRRYRPSPTKWLWFGGTAAIVALAVTLLSPGRLVARFGQVLDYAGSDRLMVWSQTLRVIADFPWTGCGLGAYRDIWMRYKTDMPLWETDFVHNDYLQLLAELGIVGSSIAVGILVIIILRLTHEREQRNLAIACAGALAAILVHSVDDFNLYIPANAMLVAWIAGISAALGTRPSCASAETRV